MFFGTWTVLCLFVLFPKLRNSIRQHDLFMLIPEWRFFAPMPAQGDFHLLYRDRFHDGGLTYWTEVQPQTKRRRWNIVWNPGKRERKALFDAINELTSHGPKAIEGSFAYLTLLNHVSTIPRSASPEYTQFLLMTSYGRDPEREPDVVLISGFHAL